MKILILGVDGMIGHKIYQTLSSKKNRLLITSRKKKDSIRIYKTQDKFINYSYDNSTINELLDLHKPDIIINCIGVTTRRIGSLKMDQINNVNTILPNKLSMWTKKNQKWLIHFSTDCVFTGNEGNYTELSKKDAKDLYGLSKSAGEEIELSNTLIIRCSLIGREIFNNTELLEWLISMNNKKIQGFSKAIYSGVSTLWMSTVIKKLINNDTKLTGLYNISSSQISKFELLNKMIVHFKLNIEIIKNDKFKSNKSLNSNKFATETGIQTPSWDEMLKDLYYDAMQNSHLYKKN
jgi:dTDP-4-dehydrorhamnose reductase